MDDDKVVWGRELGKELSCNLLPEISVVLTETGIVKAVTGRLKEWWQNSESSNNTNNTSKHLGRWLLSVHNYRDLLVFIYYPHDTDEKIVALRL